MTASRSHSLAYMGSPFCPLSILRLSVCRYLAALPGVLPQGEFTLTAEQKGACLRPTAPTHTSTHRAPGLEGWSQEGLLPAALWQPSSEKHGPLLPEKLKIQICVSATGSKRMQLTHVLAKTFQE